MRPRPVHQDPTRVSHPPERRPERGPCPSLSHVRPKHTCDVGPEQGHVLQGEEGKQPLGAERQDEGPGVTAKPEPSHQR